MPCFEITARSDAHRDGNHLHINKGQTFTINVNSAGITPNNLFNNSRCADSLYRQFQKNDINVPRTDPLFRNSGLWEIKMK